MNPLYLFIHLIKSGGTTISYHLEEYLDGKYVWYNGKIEDQVFVQGHDLTYGLFRVFPNRDVRYLTIIRDPYTWLISQYHQDIARRRISMPFDEWYNIGGPNSVNPMRGNRNLMTKWYGRLISGGLGCIKLALKSFWFVGITEKLDEDLPLLFNKLGVPNEWENKRVSGEYDHLDKRVNPVVYKPTEKDRMRIYVENEEDCELYSFAKELRKEKLNNLKE